MFKISRKWKNGGENTQEKIDLRFASLLVIVIGLSITEDFGHTETDKTLSAKEETKTVYRAFPKFVKHPSKNRILSEKEFNQLEKISLHSAKALCPGHEETIAWYAKDDSGRNFYLLQIKPKDKPDTFLESLCTFTPYKGMDQIDGLFASDAEEYILNKELGYISDSLKIFDGREEVPIGEYLKARGMVGLAE